MNLGALETNTVYCMDALDLLNALPDESVNCIVTSPPYFGLRDYGVEGQIGLEATPGAYVETLVTVFREARRVLRSDGTFWLNLGDTYSNAGKWGGSAGYANKQTTNAGSIRRTMRNAKAIGAKPKDLLMIPARAALALQADGWYLRADIIWAKPNPMPESVQDRPTKSHEHVFLLAKSERYFYDNDAIKEPAQDWGVRDRSNGKYTSGDVPISGGKHGGLTGIPKQDAVGKRQYTGFNARWNARAEPLTKRNLRDVWTIPTQPYPGAHFAVMPEALVKPCILAGCPEGGIVLDPFIGSGTVARVAHKLGRQYLGCDLNPAYVEMANNSLQQRSLYEIPSFDTPTGADTP